VAAVATYAPVALLLGIVVGLAASSRWRIVRRLDYDRWAARHDDAPH
jgi:hypothetical protein